MRRVMLIALALVAALGLTASTATAETGITAKNVTIGGTFPLTGPASGYAPIPVAMKAYFSYINARKGADGKRGVFGRQIVFNYLDDGYNPANSVQLTRQLVEQDKVFAVVGSLGHRGEPRDQAVPQREEGATAPERHRRDDLGARLEEVPVDDRLAARLRARGQDLRTGDRPQQPERQDRRPLPERRLRQGLSPRPGGRSRRQDVEHRRQGGLRGLGARREVADREAARHRRDGVRHLRDAEVHDPVVRDREGARLDAAGDLHELGVGHRHDPHARPEVRRRHARQQHVHDAVHEGSCEPEVGQRRGHEAVPRR